MKMRSVNGDIEVPTVGFGTWAFGDNSWCGDATLHAIKAGYRHLDCAWHYGVMPFLPCTPWNLPHILLADHASG